MNHVVIAPDVPGEAAVPATTRLPSGANASPNGVLLYVPRATGDMTPQGPYVESIVPSESRRMVTACDAPELGALCSMAPVKTILPSADCIAGPAHASDRVVSWTVVAPLVPNDASSAPFAAWRVTEHDPKNEELIRFRREAAEAPGISVKTSDPSPAAK